MPKLRTIFVLTSIVLSLTSFSSTSSAQDAVVVYALGGEASPEEYAAALGAVSTALRTAGRQPQAAEANCEPDHDCVEAVLQAHACVAAAVVTYWAQSESRDVPRLTITLADETGLVAIAEDIPEDAALTTTAAEMVDRAFYDWPRRAGVILHLDTIPNGRPVRIDGVMVQSPVTRIVALGRHEVVVGAAGLIRRDFVVHGETQDEINLVVRVDEESGAGSEVVTQEDETNGASQTTTEGSAWPSYAVGGGLVLAGAALWVSPILTMGGSGDFEGVSDPGPPVVVERTAMDGGQIALAVAGSVLAVAGVTLMVGGWLRTFADVSQDGASLRLEGTF